MPFSKQHADAACNFFELILKHTQDEWFGKPFLLMPWQEEAVAQTFGLLDSAGNRIIQMVYEEVPKKAGKTEWAAGLALLVLILSVEPGCQVYGAAAATRQAMNVYRAACKMVEQSPLLRKRLRIMRGTNRIVKRNDPDSFYAAIAADGDFGDGVNPSCVIADEVHRWRTRKHLENWDVLTNGGFTRRQTLTIAITTAGVKSESPLAWRLHEKARKINEGVVLDPTFFGRIYGASPDDDPASEATWIKVNPSLKENGGFLDKEKIRQQYMSHLAEGDLSSFKRYFLNLWDQKENRAIDMNLWNACRREWDAAGWPLPNDLLRQFINRRCWVGVDISMTTDLSAVVAVFPREDGGYDALPWCWMPEATLRKRQVQDGMPYERWVEEGWIETCVGRVIDNSLIKARIKYCLEMFDVQEVCFDRYNSREMSTSLVDEGVPCVEIPQTCPGLNEATKKLIALVATGDLIHGGHPVMAHHASCLCTVSDGNDLIKPVKPDREKDFSRIDLLAATIDGLARAIVFEDKSVSHSGLRSVG